MAFTRIRKTVTAVATSTLAVVGVFSFIAAAPPAGAALPDGGTASAFGIHVTLLGGNVLGPIPSVTLPADGSPVVASQVIPLDVPNLLTANTLTAVASSTNFGTPSEDILASAGVEGNGTLPGLSIANILDVQAVESTCSSSALGSVASTTIVGLSIDGAAPLNLPSPIAPNTGLTAAELGPLAGLVTITLNQQAQVNKPDAINGTAITVDALVVTLLSALGPSFNTSITVAQSSCTATGPDIEAPPTVTGIVPKYGPIAGNTPVTITGTGFFPGSTVSFSGTPATNVTVVSPTEITADSPPHAAGAVDVRVTNIFGPSAINANDVFTYEAIPVINVNGISPLFGPTAGGTLVTIAGANFGPDSTVTFGANAATNVTVVSPTEITADTPPGPAGPVSVTVTDGGGSATAAQQFTYVAPPTILSFTPLFGPTGGGTPLTITGTGFAGPTTVEIGGQFATSVNVVSSTEITALTPGHSPGGFFVTVADPGGLVVSTQKFTFVAPPNITSFTPTSGPTTGGTVVTITGSGLTDTTSVTFGGVAGTAIDNISDTSITVVTPANPAGGVPVSLTSAGGTAAVGTFTYVLAPVTVTNVNPHFGPIAGGTSISVTGAGFAPGSTVAFVNLGGGPSTPSGTVTYNSATSLTVISPTHAVGTVDIIVTTPGLVPPSSFPVVGDQFTFEDVPTITGLSPISGPTSGGTVVTITGTNFGQDAAVTFNGAAGTVTGVAPDGTSLTVVTPIHAAGPTTVKVIDGGGTATAAQVFTFVGAPAITSIVPNAGPTLGGNTVTINGSGLTGTTAVTFAGNPGTGIVNTSDSSITVVVPAGAVGPATVSVTTPGGTTSVINGYTYVAAPTITSFTPLTGPTAGGTLVTFTGTNLSGTTAITFGAFTGTSVTNLSSTSVTVLTPNDPTPGPVAVQLTTLGGTATAPQQFTYVGAPGATGLSPLSGPIAGGTIVTITGSSLTGTTNVTFGGVPATMITNVSDNDITVVDPAHAAGAVPVSITASGGTANATQMFTYVAPPVLSSISPPSGTTAGGTIVTITGSGFLAGSTVTIGGNPATSVVVNSATSITATTPPGTAGAQPVVVSDLGGPSNALSFTYIAPPIVGANGLNPAFGSTAGGLTITITGQNLSGTTAVTFDGLAATGIANLSNTEITAVDPAHGAGPVPVVITASGGTATAAQEFTYVATPTISGLSPGSGPVAGGTIVTITGAGFAGPTTVNFGANAATGVTVVNSTTITAVAPASTTGISTVNVTVTDAGGTSGALPFAYVAAPIVSGISPTSGPIQGGETVTIEGSNLCGNTVVSFGSNNATILTINSPTCTILTVTEPAGTGTVPVTVTTTGGSALSPENFTYIAPGYWEAASDGGVFAFGGAQFLGSVPGQLKPGQKLNSPIVAMADTPDHGGYWLFAADGGVFSFGDAPFYGSIPEVLKPGQVLNGPVVTAEATPDGGGYRMFAADGGVFDFGDALYEGGLPGENIFPTSPVSGATAYPFGQGANPNNAGYWLVAANGGIYSFGNAPNNLGDGLGKIFGNVVALATTPDGQGYYMFLQNGPIAAFGDATQGLGGATNSGAPIVFGQSTSTGKGAWEFATNGAVFSFGDAPFEGSLSITLNAPITAAIAFGAM